MRIIRPLVLTITVTLAILLPHNSSLVVSAQTNCVLPLASVTAEGSWSSDCLSRNREDAYARYYTFSLIQRSDVSITLESETDPYIFLLSGSGTDAAYLAEYDDICTASTIFTGCVNGFYRFHSLSDC